MPFTLEDDETTEQNISPISLPQKSFNWLAQGLDIPADIFNLLKQFGHQNEPIINTPTNATEQALSFYKPIFGKEPIETPSETIRKVQGITPQQIEPSGTFEDYLQRLLQYTPAASLGGPTALGRNILGSAVGTGAKELGFPEWIQNLLHGGTEVGLGLAKGEIPILYRKNLEPGQKRIFPKAKGAQTLKYEAAKKAGEKIEYAPNLSTLKEDLLNPSSKIEQKLAKETNKEIATKVRDAIVPIEKAINEKGIKFNDLFAIKKNINVLKEKFPKEYKHYLDDITEAIDKHFNFNMFENPEFYQNWSAGNQLTQAKHMSSIMDKFANFIGDNIPGVGKLGKLAIKNTLGIGLGSPEKFVRRIMYYPEAREHYLNALKATYKNDPSQFLVNVGNLAQELQQKEESKSKWTIEK